MNTSSSKRRYTPEEDEKITRGYNDGLTWYEVASDMNRTAKAIKTRFRTNLAASSPKKSSARWNDVDDKLLVDCRGKGELFRAIATKLDRTFDSVRKRYNLLVPTALKDTARNRYRPSEDLALLRLRDKEHKTFREIGILLRRPRSSIQARYRSLSDLQVISGNDSSLFNAQYTPFEDAKILRMKEREDASFREIADELGRTSRSVQGRYYHYLRDWSHARRRGRLEFWTNAEDRRLIELRTAGFNFAQIAAELPLRSRHAARARYQFLMDEQSRISRPIEDPSSLVWDSTL